VLRPPYSAISRLRGDPRVAALTDLFSLFAGRAGGILVTLFFIPQYNRLLGADVFGSVAIVLSLQAFFLVSDLGLATLVSRDTAIARDDPEALTAVVWMRRRAEVILFVLAGMVAVPATLLPLAGEAVGWSLASGVDAAIISVLVVALVATNVAQLSLNALGLYRVGASLSVAGAIARGGATVLVLHDAPSLVAFLQVQLAMAVLHFLVARWLLERRCRPLLRYEPLWRRDAIIALLRRCVPLTVYTLASAAAVNLDKSIVSAFISLETAGAYFLATTYALVPVAILSGPLNSYFAPRVAHARHAGDGDREYCLALIFQLVLMCTVIAPSLSLAFQMHDWLQLWLHDQAQAARIMEVAPILLAGGALSATGYYPTTYLIAAGDNGYLARLSLVCGAGVIIAAVYFASRGDLIGVAWSYFAFYAGGFAGLWHRFGRTVGWRALAGFLARAYAVPTAVIGIGYFIVRALVGDRGPGIAALLAPMVIATASGVLVSAVVFWHARSRPTRV